MHNFVNYAHRGASSYAPENTMVSFRKGIEMGANGIELDLQKTKDGKIVIFHDKVIDNKSNGTGEIKDYTYEQLLEMDFGGWFDDAFKGEPIALFEDFAKEFLALDLTFAIELKVVGLEKEALEIINQYKKHDNIYISSFEYEALENFRKINKDMKLSWLVEKITQDNINELLKINGSQICPRARNTEPEDMELAKANGLSVRFWGISDETVMREMYKYDSEGMTVNFPDKLVELMANDK